MPSYLLTAICHCCRCPLPPQVGAEIVKKALTYPLKLIAENAGTNGSVVMQRVIDSQDPNYGYNAAIDKFEDLMQSGIIDPTKVR
jgi:chaperonin GroEL